MSRWIVVVFHLIPWYTVYTLYHGIIKVSTKASGSHQLWASELWTVTIIWASMCHSAPSEMKAIAEMPFPDLIRLAQAPCGLQRGMRGALQKTSRSHKSNTADVIWGMLFILQPNKWTLWEVGSKRVCRENSDMMLEYIHWTEAKQKT